METTFYKMHGLGNDFILIDCIENKSMQDSAVSRLTGLAAKICSRRLGIGADQLLLLYPSEKADFRMRIFNADGSEVEMCGNGIRCLAKYVWNRRYSNKKILDIETMAGIIRPEKNGDNGDMVKVDMGRPALDAMDIPVKLEGEIMDFPLKIEDMEFNITCVSMGNPHTVIFIDNTDDFAVSYYGPLIENHELFPGKTNVEFVQIINRDEIKMRVWERGAGETPACGTGASAAAVASALKGLTRREVTVHLSGGDLFLKWDSDGHVFMTGPAVTVFEGKIDI